MKYQHNKKIVTVRFYSSLVLMLFVMSLISGCTSVENKSTVTQEDIQNGKTASFTLMRKKNSWVAILANVNVYINEIPMGHVENGEDKTFYFIPSKDGTTNFRLESSDIDAAGLVENVAKDTTLTSRLRKEFILNAKPKDIFKFYCSLDSKELLVRKIEN